MRAIRCAYCGDVADTRDHVIPCSYLRPDCEGSHHYRASDWLVPACRECNVTLGARLLFTVPDRAAFLLARFRAKWRKLLASPDWTPEELDETEGFFRKQLESLAAQKLLARHRLEHLELIASMDETYLAPE